MSLQANFDFFTAEDKPSNENIATVPAYKRNFGTQRNLLVEKMMKDVDEETMKRVLSECTSLCGQTILFEHQLQSEMPKILLITNSKKPLSVKFPPM